MSVPPPPAELTRALGAFARRWRLQRALTALGATVLVALPLGTWGHAGGPGWALWTGWILGFGAPLAAAAWPLALARVAREADRVASLHGSCDTALHLAATGHPAAQIVALDAQDALAQARPAPLAWRASAGAVALATLVATPAPWLEARRQAQAQAETAELLDALDDLQEEALDLGAPDLADQAEQLQDLVVQVLSRDLASESDADAEPEAVEEPEQGGAAASDPDIAGVQAALDVARHQLGPEEIARLTEQLHQLVDVRDRLHELSESTTTGTVAWRDQQTPEALQRPSADHLKPGNQGLDDFQRDLDIPGMDLAATENEALPDDLGDESIGNPEHELGLVFQQTIDDFIEDYAQAMLQDLQELLDQEAERPPEDQLAQVAEAGGTFEEPPGDEGTPTDVGAQATATASQGGEALARAGSSGIGNTDPGGSGAGKGTGGEGDAVEIDEARGQLAPLEADADLDQLGPSARRDLIAAVSRHATAEDVGLGIDALAEPYFLEVDQALDADGVPPAMQAVIASYFESLQGSAPNSEATP